MKIRYLLVFVLALMLSISAGAETVPTMFFNDREFEKFDIQPVNIIDSRVYVPEEFFTCFEQIERKADSDSFCLYNKKTGGFVSVSLKAGNSIVTKGGLADIRAEKTSGFWYLPIELCAEELSLVTDTKDFDGAKRYRLCDGRELLSFEELLWRYAMPDAPLDLQGELISVE